MKITSDNSDIFTCKKSTRRMDVDFFRGIGIICMIWGHIIFSNIIFNTIIHSFHMQMFFIISGMFWKPCSNYSEFLKKKAKSLLLPYLVFGLFHYLVYIVFYYHDSNMPKLTPIIKLLGDNTDGLPIAGALWFLTALFFCEIIFTFVKHLNNLVMEVIIITLLTIIGVYIPYLFDIRLPLALDVSLACLPFFAFGHIFKCINELNKYWTPVVTIVVLALGLIISLVNGMVNIRASQYSIVPLFYIAAVLISIGLLKLSKKVCEITSFSVIRLIIKEFCFVGKNSIVFLIFNQLVILILAKLCQFLPIPRPVEIVTIFFITIIILHLGTLILNLKPLNKLLGK